MEHKELLEITNLLRNRLRDYRESYDFINGGKIAVYMVNAFDIAIALTELGITNHREITQEEKHWFEGTYQANFEFGGGKFDDIYQKYSQLASAVMKLNYFQKEA